MVIVPTYNELLNIDGILTRIHAAVPDAQVLVVDDDSPDGTGHHVARRSEHDTWIRVVHRTEKSGLGAAYREGFSIALDMGADYVAEIDADGSHNPADLTALFGIAESRSAGLVLGSRWISGGSVQGWSALRRAISRIGNSYSRVALKSRVHDLTAGFRVLSRDALLELDRAHTASNGYCFQVEVTHTLERAGFTIIEHPITFIERAQGVSKMHSGIVGEALIRITAWGIALRLAAAAKRFTRIS